MHAYFTRSLEPPINQELKNYKISRESRVKKLQKTRKFKLSDVCH
jgi:hypothetical protein